MITIDGKTYRNLVEQVRHNQLNIEYLKEYDVKLSGHVLTPSELPETAEIGTSYEVGSLLPYNLYVYLETADGNEWVDLGKFPAPGPQGPQGEQGPQGPQGTRGSKWSTQGTPQGPMLGDQILDSTGQVFEYSSNGWVATVSLRGPQGIQGPVGPTGPTGPQGVQGIVGPTGPAGEPFSVIGIVETTSQLPAPSEVPDSYAYLVGPAGGPYDLYVQVVPDGEEQQWVNTGEVQTATGPTGPRGLTGPTGPTGPQGPQGPEGPAGGGPKVWISPDTLSQSVAGATNQIEYVFYGNSIRPANGNVTENDLVITSDGIASAFIYGNSAMVNTPITPHVYQHNVRLLASAPTTTKNGNVFLSFISSNPSSYAGGNTYTFVNELGGFGSAYWVPAQGRVKDGTFWYEVSQFYLGLNNPMLNGFIDSRVDGTAGNNALMLGMAFGNFATCEIIEDNVISLI